MEKRQFWRRRLAIVAIVVIIAIIAWRFGGPDMLIGKPKCVPDRQEERDASGKVVRITTRICKD